MTIEPDGVAEALRRWIESQGLSNFEAAERLGVSESEIGALHPRCELPPEVLLRMAQQARLSLHCLVIDSGMYVLARRGSGYAKKKILEHFLHHVDLDVEPSRELLRFVADFVAQQLPSVKNAKGFHENDFEQWENALEVQEMITTGAVTSVEDAWFAVAQNVTERTGTPISDEAIKKHWQRFSSWVRAGEIPPFEEISFPPATLSGEAVEKTNPDGTKTTIKVHPDATEDSIRFVEAMTGVKVPRKTE